MWAETGGDRGREAVSNGVPLPPKFDYHLDESDPDVLVLRRQDGAFVATFGARATREGIVEAAREDYAALVRKDSGSPASSAEGSRSS
jgi:hypothetical protein